MTLDKKQMSNFMAKVDKRGHDECWPWLASKSFKGYGRFGVGYKMLGAHRVAWELFFGPIPKGMMVLHRCDNPGCVNPYHLFLGSHLANMSDMVAKGRAARQVYHFSGYTNRAHKRQPS